MQRWIASQIPKARLVVLPGRGHLFHDIWGEWVTEVEQFLTGAPRPVPTQRFLTTLVAVDIVGSTELIARIGDARWRDLLARHYELVSRRLTMHGGVEVDRAGDGFLARFDAPARAIRFARDIDREDQALGLRARAAVHTGEVEVRTARSEGSPCTSLRASRASRRRVKYSSRARCATSSVALASRSSIAACTH